MDGTGKHYAKWNKPGGEGQIPYDLTFNWNIINNNKKSKQNITRDTEVKNNLTITRGEGRSCLLYTSDAADEPNVV